MNLYAAAPQKSEDVEIDIYCSVLGDAYRVHVRPTWLPDFLRDAFDEEGEAYPVYLDFEDLDHHMTRSGVTYTRRDATTGSVQLYARGAAATVLSVWLARALASGER